MPTYLYECAKCGDEVEAWQSFTDEPLKRHSGCGGKLQKVLQPVGIVFKGSGFHRTDSRSGSRRSSADGASDGKDGKDAKSDTSNRSEKSEKSDSKAAASDATKDTKPSDTKKSAASATSK
jgi:putative FmdB family regulatory protein